MSLDMTQMEVLKRSGTPTERKHALKIMPVIKNSHFLLVTLLLCYAGAMEVS
jgi:metal transporter CNNM